MSRKFRETNAEFYSAMSQGFTQDEDAMMSQYGGMSNYGTSMAAKSQTGLGGRKSAQGGARKIQYKGRKITLEECKFVFERVWKATLDCGDEHAGEDVPED